MRNTLAIFYCKYSFLFLIVNYKTSADVFAQSDVGSYTQGRIAGDFLSSRKTAWAERCTPKTTAAALDG
jgi:hypothetical protein